MSLLSRLAEMAFKDLFRAFSRRQRRQDAASSTVAEVSVPLDSNQQRIPLSKLQSQIAASSTVAEVSVPLDSNQQRILLSKLQSQDAAWSTVAEVSVPLDSNQQRILLSKLQSQDARGGVKNASNSCEICQIKDDGFWASLHEIIEQSSYCARCRAVLAIIQKFQSSVLSPAEWSVRVLCAPQEPMQIHVYNPTAPGTNSTRWLSCFRKQGKTPKMFQPLQSLADSHLQHTAICRNSRQSRVLVALQQMQAVRSALNLSSCSWTNARRI
jgi:hypothetical protein